MTRQNFIEKLEKSPLWEGSHSGQFTLKQTGLNTEVCVIPKEDCVCVDISVCKEQRKDFYVAIDIMSDKRPYSDFVYCDARNIIYTDIDNRITLIL